MTAELGNTEALKRKTMWAEYKGTTNIYLREQHLKALVDSGDRKAIRIWRSANFFRKYSLSAEARIMRKIARARVPGMVFDVGPHGFSGYFSAMVAENRAALTSEANAYALTIFMGLFLISHYHVPSPTNFFDNPLASIPAIIGLSLLALFVVIYSKSERHSSAAKAYEREWHALEAQGVQWHFENGSYFRYIYKRNDGSYRIDQTTRQQRLNAEIQGFRRRAEILDRCSKEMLRAAGWGLGVSAVIAIACLYFHELDLLRWLPWSIGFFIFWRKSIGPYGDQIQAHAEQQAYVEGRQFIPEPRVSDPLHEPLTMEKVQEQAAMGDAAFSSPFAASQNLSA